MLNFEEIIQIAYRDTGFKPINKTWRFADSYSCPLFAVAYSFDSAVKSNAHSVYEVIQKRLGISMKQFLGFMRGFDCDARIAETNDQEFYELGHKVREKYFAKS